MKISKNKKKLVALVIMVLSPVILWGNESPIWEVGVAYQNYKRVHYPGSNHYKEDHVTSPYATLRYDYIEVSPQGLNFRMLGNDWIGARGSLSSSDGVQSADLEDSPPDGANKLNQDIDSRINYTRRGMDDIPSAAVAGGEFYLGPSFFRLSLTNNKYLKHAGGYPQIGSNTKGLLSLTIPIISASWLSSSISLGGGQLFGDREYNQLYYGVKAKDATTTRPAYEAKEGKIANISQAGWSLIFPGDFTIRFSYTTKNVGGSVIEDSPLVVTKESREFVAGVQWALFKSDSKVLLP